jgi:molecular chaperone GrpE
MTQENSESKQETMQPENSNDGPATAVDPLEEWKSRTAYLMAEIENMRKRFDRERGEIVRFANEQLLNSVIPVLDNLNLAAKAARDNLAAVESPVLVRLVEGIEMTVKHFEQTLDRVGVKSVEAVGKLFDPVHHEAISQASDESKKDAEIVSELQKGYTLNGRLLRPARVVVNKVSVKE